MMVSRYGLICISLITDEVEHIFIRLLAFLDICFYEGLLTSLAHFCLLGSLFFIITLWEFKFFFFF